MGEGGFTYRNLGSPYSTYGTSAATSVTTLNPGNYAPSELQYCNDYVDMDGSGDFSADDIEINNDCDSGANCKDDDCTSTNPDDYTSWRTGGFAVWASKL